MKDILHRDVQQYINANLKTDLHSLLLKKSPFENVSMQEIAQQIKGSKVAEKKFPFLLKENIVFPPNLNLEQTSSQATAIYKSQFLKGKKFIDLTSGFGIDAWFLSAKFEEITLVEQNSKLLEIVEHNWETLDRKAKFINRNLEEFLKSNTETFDVVYLDPARRNDHKQKVFLLEDLSPNLLEIQHELLKISEQVIIKLSPLIDLKYLMSVLKNISKIEVIAVKNEVKEILVVISSKSVTEKIFCKCVNLESDDPDFEFYFGEEENISSEFSEPSQYLYIPNNAVLKSGAFNLISSQFNIKKLHPNTHFYTSNQLIENFPGRRLEVQTIDAKELKKGDQFNIISKNHPLSPEEIKKKYKLKDGGTRYLLFTQTQKGKIILKSV